MNRANRKSLLLSLSVVAAMLALVAASVPLYRLFCAVTGLGGTTQIADGAAVQTFEREIRVRFSGSVERSMPWDFAPVAPLATVKVGERHLAFFRAHNPTDKPITGQAAFNVTPFKAGPYFDKVACFCFTEQTLAPGETVDMPVSFYIDPAIMADHDLDDVTEITLNYTFFMVEDRARDTLASAGGS